MKKLFSLLLAVAASVGTMFAESGTCGESLTWDLTNGVLTISGTGAMNNYGYSNGPWYGNRANISQVVINDGVTSIGIEAFRGCTGLTSVTIPNSVTSIGDRAFWGCSGLTSVTIPNSVTSIGRGAFGGCSGLTSIIVESGNTVYDSRNNCNAIIETATNTLVAGCKNTTIPNSVTSIGSYAFAYCEGLTSVTIPNSVTSIGQNAFEACAGLTAIDVAADNPNYCAEEGVLFSKDKTTLVAYPGGKKGAYSIPNSVTSIGNNAFYECSGLTSVTIGNSVTSIGDGDFCYCDGLTSVTIEAETPPTLGSYAFYYNTNCPIYVPCGTLDAYKTAWTNYASRISYAPLPYKISTQAVYGSVGITSLGNYTTCDEQPYFYTLTATPDSGYYFIQWSDGVTDNPRTIVMTQDTILTAIFAMDTTGTCGKDYALTWSYSPTSETLTISGNGSFDENMECGVVAKQEMTKLVINEGVTAIGNEAFSNCENLTTMQLPTTLKTIGERAFYNCLDLVSIYNYRVNPCLIETNTFEKVNTFDCVLYVLASSIAKYKSDASGWKIFFDIKPIDATTVDNQVTDVTVVPSDNNATVIWPTSENAATYTIEITKDGEVFCTLIFNGNGQLTGIAFAPGKNGNHHAPAAQMTANGLQFTVTGLNSATHYALTLQAKDDQDAVLASYSSEFTTTGEAQGIDNTPFPSGEGRGEASKILRDGQIFILRGDKTYTVTGAEVR